MAGVGDSRRPREHPPNSPDRAPLQVFTPTVRTSLEGPWEGTVWSHAGPRSAPKSFSVPSLVALRDKQTLLSLHL